jgi:hypothetical protein
MIYSERKQTRKRGDEGKKKRGGEKEKRRGEKRKESTYGKVEHANCRLGLDILALGHFGERVDLCTVLKLRDHDLPLV